MSAVVAEPKRKGAARERARRLAPARSGAEGALILSRRHLAQIEEHARRAYPEECCGVLVGVRRGGRVIVSSVQAAINRCPERRRDRYEVDPETILRLQRESAAQRRQIVGFYHSHPDHAALPSATDAAQAWPEYVYLITGVNDGQRAQTRAWVFDASANRFQERPLVARRTAIQSRAQAAQRA